MRPRYLHRHHPWRAFGLLSDWTIEWTDDLPFGVWGHTLFDEKVVLLANGLSQAERRCTIEHERQHVLRGPAPLGKELAEELEVDRIASRLLLPSIRRIGHALGWHRADIESAADELWVDETMLHIRLSSLRPTEKAWLDEQLETVLL